MWESCILVNILIVVRSRKRPFLRYSPYWKIKQKIHFYEEKRKVILLNCSNQLLNQERDKYSPQKHTASILVYILTLWTSRMLATHFHFFTTPTYPWWSAVSSETGWILLLFWHCDTLPKRHVNRRHHHLFYFFA